MDKKDGAYGPSDEQLEEAQKIPPIHDRIESVRQVRMAGEKRG